MGNTVSEKGCEELADQQDERPSVVAAFPKQINRSKKQQERQTENPPKIEQPAVMFRIVAAQFVDDAGCGDDRRSRP